MLGNGVHILVPAAGTVEDKHRVLPALLCQGLRQLGKKSYGVGRLEGRNDPLCAREQLHALSASSSVTG